jgi:hypothetical protein
VLSVHILQQLSCAQGDNKPDCSHRQEAQSGVTSIELVDFLRDQDDVVDDILVGAIASCYLLVISKMNTICGLGNLLKPITQRPAKLRIFHKDNGIIGLLI